MEFQNLVFNDGLVETTLYSSYNSPPYHSSPLISANTSWNDSFAQLVHPFSTDVLQMHHLRFPTPPTTPPKEPAIVGSKSLQPEVGCNQRTQSVIMKIGQCQNMYQNLTDIADVDKHGILSSDNQITSSDLMCSWINCKRCFENLEYLAAHVNKVHAIASVEDGLYYCRWDGCARFDRGFNARYKMLVHVRTHTKEKPHHCHLCEKCFSRAENLKIHIRSHSGEKPYICTYEGCQKAYSNSSDRFKHTRTHSMEKPYLCKVPGCQKRYTDPSSLRKHIKTFKHSEQLIDSKLMTHASAFKTYTNTKNEQNNLNSTEDTAYKKQYYVNSAGICYMEEDEFSYYYGAEKKETNTYSLGTDLTEYKDSYFVNNVDMDISKELPLDLRINRIT